MKSPRGASTPPEVVIDTQPLLKLLTKEEGWEPIHKLITMVERGKVTAGISTVTLTEIYYIYLREGGEDLAQTRTEQLRGNPHLEKMPVGEDVAVTAGRLKGKHRIPISDAFIAATAHIKKRPLISDDPDFKKITEIETLTSEELNKLL